MNKPSVSLVITSCGRFDLLQKTIKSLDAVNTYTFNQKIIIEDSGDIGVLKKIQNEYGHKYNVIFNDPKLGQIKSIDYAYSQVTSPYIFHCEDDWEFTRKGFLEESMDILESDENILQVWLRAHNDTNGHPVLTEQNKTALGTFYHFLEPSFTDSGGVTWHGFSFNPGLRRLSDYKKLAGGYSGLGHEKDISHFYHNQNMRVAILSRMAVRHIGWGHHVLDTVRYRDNLLLKKIKNFLSNIKSRLTQSY